MVEFGRLFDALDGIFRNEGIAEAESAWAGGVSDFGDPSSASIVQAMPGYFDYRSDVEEALAEHLGWSFTVYRLMPRCQYEDWLEGNARGQVAVSLEMDVADSFRRFAGNADRHDLVLVEFDVSPSDVVMVGKRAEAELVLDSEAIVPDKVRVLGDTTVPKL